MEEKTDWEPNLILPQVHISSVRSDNRTGGFKLTLDIFPDNVGTINAAVLLTMFQKNAEVQIKVSEE